MKNNPKRIAMWSGPRNISTALMRSFENRSDTTVIDEPFYAYFLNETGIKHPIYKEVIQNYDTSWDNISNTLTGPIPNGKSIWYQKLMTHHWIENAPLDWLEKNHNCFLIRNPKQVIISYLKIHNDITPELIGLPQQLHIFNTVVKKTSKIPVVISSEDILENPKLMLNRLCDLLDIPFSDQMLQWPKGKRKSDGIWGEYWYKNVVKTTSFNKSLNQNEKIPDRFLNLLEECISYYKQMEKYKINNG
jgi:hypothetical protein